MSYSVDDIKKLAYIGEELPPPSIPPPDRILWYSFRDLYMRFKQKKITKEQSQKEADMILKTYQNDRTVFEESQKIWSYHGQMWAEIELAGSRYAKNRTLENADAFQIAVYGVGIKQNMIKPEQDTLSAEHSAEHAAELIPDSDNEMEDDNFG